MGFNIRQWGAITIAALFGLSFIGFIGVGGGADAQAAKVASSDIEYNGFVFVPTDGYWVTTINNQEIYFISPPSALESFEVPANTDQILTYSKVYIAYDPNQKIDLTSIQSRTYSFLSAYNVQTFLACSTEEGCPDIPVIDCNDDHAIIFLQNDNVTSIEANGNCLELNARNVETMQRQLERIFYSALGIME